MERLFSRIRWRLVGWTLLILGLILGVLGTTVYAAVGRSLADQVDRNLASRAEQALPVLFGPPSPGGRGRFEGREGYRGGVFYLAIGPEGQVFANPQQVNLDTDAVPTPAGRRPVFGTIELNGEPTRVFVRPMPDGGKLVVGQSLAPEQNALQSLLLILVAGGGLGLLLSFAGAWFLAGRALVPIQQAFRRQQEFVADASHELRTPLTVLRTSAELLNQHRDEPLVANGELFDDIRADIARLERLARDLLTLARSDRGELELMVAPLDLGVLASDVVRRLAPLAQGHNLHLGLTARDTSPEVEADPDRLQQVLLILLDNAINHTPPGGHVDVRVRTDGAHGILEVVDTGSGIAPEHLPRIFDRFYRVDAARSSDNGGTGLGLAIAKMLVDAHGGDIAVTSTPGTGTRVTVRLPLANRPASLGGRLAELAGHLAHAPTHQ